jgi:F-type H+-transporting ATPase subunit alpha
LRRPPGREAFPGDIFYVHSRLLERSTHLRPEHGGGSLTVLPIIETEAQNISAYIPTNLISITDGQIYLSPDLFQKGILPAVDVGKSVSRVGGKAQLPPYRKLAGELRLTYSQFHELEAFSRFGTRLDEHTRQTLEHGKRVREVLKQNQFSPLSVGEQIAVLMAVNSGLLDTIPIDKLPAAQDFILNIVRSRPELMEQMEGDNASFSLIGFKLLDNTLHLAVYGRNAAGQRKMFHYGVHIVNSGPDPFTHGPERSVYGPFGKLFFFRRCQLQQ